MKSRVFAGSRIRDLSDSPIVVAGLATVAGLVFVIARLIVAAHGNVSIFIVAGSDHASAARLPPGIAVRRGSGYDGQFYYRMALDPANMARSAFGIRVDTISRFERIGYPAIAWLLALGRHSLVPDTLVATNVLALGVLGYGGGLLARESGRHAMWGAVFAGFWGYLWSAGRDLTEITAAAFLLLGLYAYRRQRWVPAGVFLLAASLSKETAAYVVVIIAATRLWEWVSGRRRQPLAAADVAWAVPILGFITWQGVVLAVTGSVPVLSSGNSNLGLPFVGLSHGVHQYLTGLPSRASLIWVGELVVLVALTVVAGLSIRKSSAPVHERWAWAAVVLLAISAANGIWVGDVGFRSLDTVYLFSWLVLLGTPRRLGPLSGLVGVTWVLVAFELIAAV
ncbi:MAG: hypothetical protein WBG41_03885 [Acidimicrobiales bacterium]